MAGSPLGTPPAGCSTSSATYLLLVALLQITPLANDGTLSQGRLDHRHQAIRGTDAVTPPRPT